MGFVVAWGLGVEEDERGSKARRRLPCALLCVDGAYELEVRET